MATVYDAAEGYRHALERRERAAAAQLIRAYQDAVGRIMREAEQLLLREAEARAAGEAISPSWLYRQERYRQLLGLIGREMEAYADVAAVELSALAQDAVGRGLEETRALVAAQAEAAGADAVVASRWVSLNPAQVANMVGATQSGPLRALLATGLRQAPQLAGDTLVRGSILGWNPRRTARELRRTMGVPLARALTISRTETLRAQRMATGQAIQRNSHLCSGWRWQSARDRRTCPTCWAADGSLHRGDEMMATHPNCRCTMVPTTKSWDEILGPQRAQGMPDTSYRPPDTGPERFAKLSPDVQRHILGPGKYREYAAGRLNLHDLRTQHQHPAWGPTSRERSLRDLRSMGLLREGANADVFAAIEAAPQGAVGIASCITELPPASSLAGAAARDALAALDRVMQVPGGMLGVPMRYAGDLRDAHGWIRWAYRAGSTNRLRATEIQLTAKGAERGLADATNTYLHELGHYLDLEDAGGIPGLLSSEGVTQHAAQREIMAALERTGSIRKMVAERRKLEAWERRGYTTKAPADVWIGDTVQVGRVRGRVVGIGYLNGERTATLALEDGSRVRVVLPKGRVRVPWDAEVQGARLKYVRYFTSGREQWARAFAQFVATTNGGSLEAAIRAAGSYQWPPGEWRRIQPLFARLWTELGLAK